MATIRGGVKDRIIHEIGRAIKQVMYPVLAVTSLMCRGAPAAPEGCSPWLWLQGRGAWGGCHCEGRCGRKSGEGAVGRHSGQETIDRPPPPPPPSCQQGGVDMGFSFLLSVDLNGPVILRMSVFSCAECSADHPLFTSLMYSCGGKYNDGSDYPICSSLLAFSGLFPFYLFLHLEHALHYYTEALRVDAVKPLDPAASWRT